MKRLTASATLTIVMFCTLASGAAGSSTISARSATAAPFRGCHERYTVNQAKAAARHVYAGTRHVTKKERRRLGWIERCQRNQHAIWYVRWYYGHQRAAWLQRVAPPLQGPVIASWFDDAGATACGTHYTYGFATLLPIACGQSILMRGPSGVTVRAYREDSGPYVSGRTFDLNPGLRDALGCGGLCSVRYR